MAPVPKVKFWKIVVKADLPEFDGSMNLEVYIQDLETSWNEFFQEQKIPFDSAIHVVRSSKRVACGEDSIQETACLYQRNRIIVKLEEDGGKRKSARIQARAISAKPATRALRNGSTPPPALRQFSYPKSSIVRVYPEDDGPGYIREETRNYKDYAASMVSSADDEDEDDGDTGADLKEELIRHLRVIPRSDLLRAQKEVKQLRKNFDVVHRWSRRAPFVSTLVFNLFDR